MTLHKSVSTIVDIIDLAERNKGILLSGLEHLDERYVKAVGYTTKAARAELPRMILLIDISSDDEEQLVQVSSEIVDLAKRRMLKGLLLRVPRPGTVSGAIVHVPQPLPRIPMPSKLMKTW